MKLAFNFPGGSIGGVAGMPEGGVDTFGKTLQVGITLLFITVTLAALIFLILGGIQWIISQGDKTKVEAARKKITYAIIGLIVAFASYLIISVIGNFFGVKLLDVPGRAPGRVCNKPSDCGRPTQWECINHRCREK